MSLEQRIDYVLFHFKHWQVFTLLAGSLVLSTMLQFNFLPVLYLVYFGLLSMRLRKYLPQSYQSAYTIFVISVAIAIIGWSFVLVVPPSVNTPVALSVGLINIVSYVTVLSFVARAIKSLETHDRATVNDYFGDIFLLFLFLPFGVWFIQPRLNLLGDQFFRD